jgi:hypothetical protein
MFQTKEFQLSNIRDETGASSQQTSSMEMM